MINFHGREWDELTREEKREAEKTRFHFMQFKQSTNPIFMLSRVRKSWHAGAIRDILGRGRVDSDKKLRIIINYDPEYPLIDLDVMEFNKVNAELYLKIKEAVESGDYTVEEAVEALEWIRVEYIRKWNPVLNAIKANEIKHFDDWYDQYHSEERAPEVN